MNNKTQKKSLFILVGLFVLLTIALGSNAQASRDKPAFGCHPSPSGYTITSDVSEIQGAVSSEQIVEVTATGTNVVVDVYVLDNKFALLENDEFTISPGNNITDNDANDLDPLVDSIRVILTITLPSKTGEYTLRILSREPTLSGMGTSLSELDIQVTVGDPTIIDIIFDHSGIYLGAIIVILACVGGIVFQINVKKRNAAKSHGILIGIALIVASVNMFLVMHDAIDFIFNSVDFMSNANQSIDQLVHIILGSVGFFAGIVVVVGTYTKVPAENLKFAVYAMLMGFVFNYVYGIFMLTPIGG